MLGLRAFEGLRIGAPCNCMQPCCGFSRCNCTSCTLVCCTTASLFDFPTPGIEKLLTRSPGYDVQQLLAGAKPSMDALISGKGHIHMV
jgi:hypothetical protein